MKISIDEKSVSSFDEQATLQKLKHYLPSQNPLKDFVHHNSLHSFEELPFHTAIHRGSKIMGYKGYLQLSEYRGLFAENKITGDAIDYVLDQNHSSDSHQEWKKRMIDGLYDENVEQKIGRLRDQWKTKLHVNLDKEVIPLLLRLVSNYLDQGISIWHFPVVDVGFLESIRYIDVKSQASLFKTTEVKELLSADDLSISKLLKLLVGEELYFEHYLFDQQFTHPGWSGMVSVIEGSPDLLYDRRKISLEDFIIVELLLELDFLYHKHNNLWSPLGYKVELQEVDIFCEIDDDELFEVFKLWQEAFEWTFYHEAISGLKCASASAQDSSIGDLPSFQGFFCIDDREMSFRQHLEIEDPLCETFGTPGHFGIVAYYKPDKGHFTTKICPAPLKPKHVLKEIYKDKKIGRDAHFHKNTHNFLWGWISSHTLGLLSGLKLFNILISPKHSAGTYYSYDHMHSDASLLIDYDSSQSVGELKAGFTVPEMADIVASILKTTGLTHRFANIVYFVGHGASSTNNPYYAGYGCGACMGRPGSANSRAAAEMANRKEVRSHLNDRGIIIPESTWFIGGLHDTTLDEILFYDEQKIPSQLLDAHEKHKLVFDNALTNNAKERARRFSNIPLALDKLNTLRKVKERAVKFFEIRPEYNHATNSLFIVGRRDITKKLFLDRRSFLNSYDYRMDPKGEQLATILNAGAGVCAGINLEYYFSRMDLHRLGAGSKLPQNIIGLIGVGNGVDGDLRTGLPYQMVEIHDPIRMMTIIEQTPAVVLDVLNNNPGSKHWYLYQWMNLVVMNPEDGHFYVYKDNEFKLFEWQTTEINTVKNLDSIVTTSRDNLPVVLIK